jgi:Protein of unknown function (DUF3047)
MEYSVRMLTLGFCALLAACSGLPTHPAATESTATTSVGTDTLNGVSAQSSSKPWSPAWQHQTLPGKESTEYRLARIDGREVMTARAASSASLFRQRVNIPATELDRIQFSWKVPELIEKADLAVRDNADSTVRIVLAFEGDRSKLSAKNAMLSELAHVLTGEPMPYATLMYVWCNTREAGSVITSSRTDRIRKIVVESGTRNLNSWMDYERNIRADFEKAFGEAPGALVGIGIMTDSDNTRSTTQAWYGPVSLTSNALRLAKTAPQ